MGLGVSDFSIMVALVGFCLSILLALGLYCVISNVLNKRSIKFEDEDNEDFGDKFQFTMSEEKNKKTQIVNRDQNLDFSAIVSTLKPMSSSNPFNSPKPILKSSGVRSQLSRSTDNSSLPRNFTVDQSTLS